MVGICKCSNWQGIGFICTTVSFYASSATVASTMLTIYAFYASGEAGTLYVRCACMHHELMPHVDLISLVLLPPHLNSLGL
jgi:hypothetical protein